MSRQLQAILLPILLICSPIFGWSGTPQAATPAADTQANAGSAASSSKQSNEARKPEKDSARKTHIHLGAITVGAGYTHFSGGPFGYAYGFYPYGFGYSPFFFDPLWMPYSPLYYPGYLTGLRASYGKGEVQLTANPRKAEVFLDGGYAGPAVNLKNIWLDPGAYDLSVVAENRPPFHMRIYVLSGKRLKVNATLGPQKPAEVKP